ncbi:hypothetical protein J4526_03855 [Desulfurococcaceae archaeon MEX13E-LK6-19]|nr:hypothetical protein J4526_03855 [Desulfurococcaceae archaeon MEX13E-LK6-19]
MAGLLYIVSSDVGIEVVVDNSDADVVKGFESSFAGRYIPSFTIESSRPEGVFVGARVEWKLADKGFKVESYGLYSGDGVDIYSIVSAPPAPYVNESPYFFILQVLARQYARRGKIVFTDAVSFMNDNGEAVMLLGYPHTGKSTLTALALDRGFVPLTTENTIVELRNDSAYIVGGTGILVYDPAIRRLYGVAIPVHEETRHGYHIVDLDKVRPERREALDKGVPIDRIYVLHCSYSSAGADYKPVKGRKIVKTLWYFATALIKGVDYYEPAPLDLSTDQETMQKIAENIKTIAETYTNRFYEIFGKHDKAFQLITREQK